LLLVLVALALFINSAHGARRLRKKPKIYNALITTDDNLTSSRAYPVIQPTIHEPGYTHAPFGPYNPFNFYSPPLVRFGQPLVPGLSPNEQLPYPLPSATQFPPVYAAYDPQEQLPREQQPEAQPTQPELMAHAEAASGETAVKEQQPLPLNNQGLPPVLIHLNSHNQKQQPAAHLPPYPYNQYPLVYDQMSGYLRQRESYLPPYDYYPSQGYPTTRNPTAAETAPPPPMQPKPLELQSLPLDELDNTPSFEDIKNGSENKNSDVPDVPPPPIPSGPKRPPPKD
ncbi:CG15506, partial [Drosophila busckii]